MSKNLPKWTPIEEATSSVSLTMLAASEAVDGGGDSGWAGGAPSGEVIPAPLPVIAGEQTGSPAISGFFSLWNGKSATVRSWLGGNVKAFAVKLVGFPGNPS